MRIISYLKAFYHGVGYVKEDMANAIHLVKIRNNITYKQERIKSEIQRCVHQLEKGLSIENPKQNFGIAKAKNIVSYLGDLNEDSQDAIEVKNRACACLNLFFEYYAEKNWQSEEADKIRARFESLNIHFDKESQAAGLINIQRLNYGIEAYETLKNIADSRHSVRNFSDSDIDNDLLLKAVSLAQRAPSACNRQGVRCYIVGNTQFPKLEDWLKSIGFFGEYGFNKIIIVTAKITDYDAGEDIQHLVSPGIFVGYLTLALESLNIGACVIQRSLFNDKKWIDVRKILSIPDDEQSFCIIGCGALKENYKVPMSKRLSTDIICRVID